MSEGFHTHPCSRCRTPVECQGDVVDNSDGWPPVICSIYHLPGGRVMTFICESCERDHEPGKVRK